jgi:glycosyltransferase involved in cell wall biosynthesis
MRTPKDELAPLSVVIPTYNRAELVAETLRICHRFRGGVPVEFIVIDDGSSDITPQVLHKLRGEVPDLIWYSVPNSGPGQARNLGSSFAQHDVILFLGDDIQPLNDDFFRTHSRIHAAYPSDRYAVLGKAVWPMNQAFCVNSVMEHIQGYGGEQFGYAHLIPYSWVDYRFFYTINVSVRKTVVRNWHEEGFLPEFTLAAFEDIEFAYRLSKQVGGFKIFYDPSSVGQHVHPYTAVDFMARQHAAGMMAKVLFDFHPELVDLLNHRDFMSILANTQTEADSGSSADYLAMVEGIKAWVRTLERQQILGRSAWHDDILTAVFELSFLQGLVIASAGARSNLSGAYEEILRRFYQRINRMLSSELTANEFMKAGLFGSNS